LKKKLPLIIILVLFAAGIVAILYPIVGNYVSKATSSVAITNYQAAVSQMNDVKRQSMLDAAKAYNATLSGKITTDAFSPDSSNSSDADTQYRNLLDVDGIMGYVEIPSIDIYLPIYHGTSEDVLQTGAGHLKGSSLPVGGLGTNAVISAHRGLPSAKLFTDLDQLALGDLFYFHVLGESLAYQVDEILVIEPIQTEALDAIPGEDHATLLTCTPYGINSHRLLVRGVRVNNPEAAGNVVTTNHYMVENEIWMVPLSLVVAGGVVLFIPLRAIVRKLLRKHNP
jgi:sortase A